EKCSTCGLRILAGGIPFLQWTFCTEGCLRSFQSDLVDKLVPAEVIDEKVRHTFEGLCPSCGRTSKNDVYSATKVTGMILAYSIDSERRLCCPSCARRNRLLAALHCLVAGWWSPRAALCNLFVLPANVIALLFVRTPQQPSSRLTRLVKGSMAEAMAPELMASVRKDDEQ